MHAPLEQRNSDEVHTGAAAVVGGAEHKKHSGKSSNFINFNMNLKAIQHKILKVKTMLCINILKLSRAVSSNALSLLMDAKKFHVQT